MKICLVSSSGGHLYQLYVLKAWWERYERFWVTFDKPDATSLLEGERVFFGRFPTNRNLLSLAVNTWLAWRLLWRERPDLIVSTGAGIAVPFYWLGKLFGARLVYMEVIDRIDSPALTSRCVAPVCDAFLVQWEEQKRFFPRGEFWGRSL